MAQFNAAQYNAAPYNIPGQLAGDGVFTYNSPMFGATQYNALLVNHYITLTDGLLLNPGLNKTEAVFLSDVRSANISNKGLSDQIELDDWLQIRRTPAQSDWTS